MIVFNNWHISTDSPIPVRQHDNLAHTLTVTGQFPEGWTWDLLVQAGKQMNVISLKLTDGHLSLPLSGEMLAQAGTYSIQLRGSLGDVVRHTNPITLFVPPSLSGDMQWPVLPTAFTQALDLIHELNQHPPVPGEDGFWRLWDTQAKRYQPSEFPMPLDSTYVRSPYQVAAAGGYTGTEEEFNAQLAGMNDVDAMLDAVNGTDIWVPGLPPVTEADDGKVLGVKDGIWSAVLSGTSPVEGLELWRDITLEEDTNTIFLDKKDNGQPFKIQELFIGIFGVISGNGAIAVSYNGGSFYQAWKNYVPPVDGDGNPKLSLVWFYSRRVSENIYLSLFPEDLLNQNSKYENDTEFSSQGLYGSNKRVFSDIAFYTGTELTATNITIKLTSTSLNFLSGSRIFIYGRDIDA